MVQPKYKIYSVNKSKVASSELREYGPYQNRYVLDEPDNHIMNREFDSIPDALDSIKEFHSNSKEMSGDTFTILPIYTLRYNGSINGEEI